MLMELRYGNIDRPLHPVQEEGLAPEARRRGPRADATMDRIAHKAVWVDMGEANMRQRRGANR